MGPHPESPVPTEASQRLSVRALARRLGVDPKAVRKAIANGRLERAVGRDGAGHPVIIDAVLAEEEWSANQHVTKLRGGRQPAGAPPLASSASTEPKPSRTKRGARRTIADEQLRLVRQQTRKLKIGNDERSGKLVNARQVETRVAACITTARNHLLGLPSRAKQRLPHLTAGDLVVMDELIRQALEELADAVVTAEGAAGLA